MTTTAAKRPRDSEARDLDGDLVEKNHSASKRARTAARQDDCSQPHSEGDKGAAHVTKTDSTTEEDANISPHALDLLAKPTVPSVVVAPKPRMNKTSDENSSIDKEMKQIVKIIQKQGTDAAFKDYKTRKQLQSLLSKASLDNEQLKANYTRIMAKGGGS